MIARAVSGREPALRIVAARAAKQVQRRAGRGRGKTVVDEGNSDGDEDYIPAERQAVSAADSVASVSNPPRRSKRRSGGASGGDKPGVLGAAGSCGGADDAAGHPSDGEGAGGQGTGGGRMPTGAGAGGSDGWAGPPTAGGGAGASPGGGVPAGVGAGGGGTGEGGGGGESQGDGKSDTESGDLGGGGSQGDGKSDTESGDLVIPTQSAVDEIDEDNRPLFSPPTAGGGAGASPGGGVPAGGGAGGGGTGEGGGGGGSQGVIPLRPCGKSRKVPTQSAVDEIDEDDRPPIKESAANKKCKKADKPGLNTDQKNQQIDKQVWSIDFAAACGHLAWYESNRGDNPPRHVWLMNEKDTAIFNSNQGLEVTITRRASPYLKKLLCMKKAHGSYPEEVSAGIQFVVHTNSGRNYYLMYHDYAGVLIVKVESIMKPDENKDLSDDAKWARTMKFRRVFETADAVRKARNQKDNGIYMGELAMREVLRTEKEENKAPTVHEGDSEYVGDIRTLVGVVRWKKEGMGDHSKDYFSENRTDLLLTGGSVSQNINE